MKDKNIEKEISKILKICILSNTMCDKLTDACAEIL